jgi:Uma2 family endonuclease
VPTSAATLAGFRAWTNSPDFPDRGCVAFLGNGIFLDMSPERLDSYNKVKTEITRVLANLVVEGDLGKFYSDRTRVVNPAAGLSNEPDATFARWESFQAGRVRQVPGEGEAADYAELEGTPDWVLEIVIPASVEKATQRLRRIYHRADILEYWLIDARGEAIDFQVLWRQRADYKKGHDANRLAKVPCVRPRFPPGTPARSAGAVAVQDSRKADVA